MLFSPGESATTTGALSAAARYMDQLDWLL